MAINFTVAGTPNQLTFTTSAALLAALPGARPGSVLTLTTVVAAFAINITNAYAAPGICIALPAAQVCKVSCVNVLNANVEIIGGIINRDLTDGSNDGLGYSVNLQNCSYIAIRGSKIGGGSNNINIVSCSDIDITDNLFEWSRGDIVQVLSSNRFRFDNWFGIDTAVKGQKLRWFTDGRLPVDGASDTSNGSTIWWDDTTHGDAAQIRGGCADFILRKLILRMIGAGAVNYGTGSHDDNRWVRAVISDCNLEIADPGGYLFAGNDISIDGCNLSPHPTSPGAYPVKFNIIRSPSGGRIRARNNQVLSGAVFDVPADINFTAPDWSGDSGVVEPAFTGLRRLPWAPAYSRPEYVPHTAAPEVVVAPKLYHTSNAPSSPPTTGTWITIGVGASKYVNTPIVETRWKRNGTVIDGAIARIYQVQSGDIGASITGEIRMTDTNGTGAWKSSAALVPA